MMRLREGWRVLRVGVKLLRYRLDEVVELPAALRPVRVLRVLLPRPPRQALELPRGERLALVLTELGPLFVKFGQILSTRRDLLPEDIADALASLQDQVPPFPTAQARATIEQSLEAPIAQLFTRFDDQPLAAASIAQVHAAQLPTGEEVVVKVLRPDIHERVAHDIGVLHAVAGLVERFHPHADKLRPYDLVAELENTLTNELDLQREGANGNVLRRNFRDSPDLHVPAVHWSHSKGDVLTLTRVYGIPVDELDALDAAGIDRVRLARMAVELFYTQVFRDNFFHADAHAGNVWVEQVPGAAPRLIALDFGIMGSLSDADQYWLAENFLALFRRDYRRIAELHLRAGWMPADTRSDELESAVRAVCERYFTRPLSEISLAEVIVALFQTARRYQLTLQPQLVLLQKTLLNIEGVARMLDPSIDIWAIAEPVLKHHWRRRVPRRVLSRLRWQIPDLLAAAPQMPLLINEYLQQVTRGQAQIRIASADLSRLHAEAPRRARHAVWLVLGATLALCATLLVTIPEPGRIAPTLPWALGLGGAWSFLMAWRTRWR